MNTLLLSSDDVKSVLSISDAIKIVEDVYHAHGKGKVVMPAKITLDLGESGKWPHFNSYVNSMPAYIGPYNIAGVKIIGGFFSNVEKGLPSIIGLILLIDPENGTPVAIMDGTYITALRTGASVAVGAKYLAKNSASTVAIIGAGTQCRFSLRALASLFRLERVYVTDIRKVVSTQFAKEMSDELELEIDVTEEPTKLFSADIVVSATTSKTPVILGKWLKKGALVEPLGSYQEIDEEVARMAKKVVVDNLDQAKHRGSFATLIENGVVSAEKIYAEISEVVVGAKRGRESDEEIIVYEPIGIGSTDVATAHVAFKRAQERSIGSNFSFI